jgi:RNA polymerase sigma factor (sigma-70 family)
MKNYTDTDLLLLVKDNGHSAFNALFDRYWKKAYQKAFARLNDKIVAQDIVQEIFINLWQRRANLDIHNSFENYLYSAVRLKVISYFRSQKAATLQLQDAFERMTLLESATESLSDYIELERVLEAAISVMPEMLQQVYLLRTENYSVKDIAGELGIADQTVKNYMGEVLRRLRVVIKEKYPEKNLTYLALILATLYK